MSYKIKEVKKLSNWEAEITGEIPLDFLTESRKEALKHLKEQVSVQGFRPGQVPDDMIVKSLGEMRILEETAEVALGKEYANIVMETKLRPITRPQISISKMAPGIPLEFKMTLTLEPEFDLPDYKKLASEVEGENGEERRLKIIDTLNKATTLEIPEKFVDTETHHMLHHFREDIEKSGIDWKSYLEQIKKTEEEVTKDWKEQVTARAKTEFILSKIAEKEGLKTYKEVFEMLEKKDLK